MKLKVFISLILLLISIYGIILTVKKNDYKKEINKINLKNDSLLNLVNNFKKSNDSLLTQIKESNTAIDEYVEYVFDQDSIIEVLNKKRHEVHNIVNDLDANGVARQLSDYLKWRSKVANKPQRGHFDSYECKGCKGNPL
jgi:uncharacterized protein YlxW (UPF0749 family)